MMTVILLSVALQAPPAEKLPASPAKQPATPLKPVALQHGGAPSTPESLDQQIARAMAGNPDLRIAQLQVEMAKAKLDQERQRVAQQITASHRLVETLKSVVDKESELMKKLEASAVFASEKSEQRGKLAESKTKLAAAEAQLQAALGWLSQVPAQVPPTNCPAFAKFGGKAVSCNDCHSGNQFTGSLNLLNITRNLEVANFNEVPTQSSTPKTYTTRSVVVMWDANSAAHKGFLADFPDMLERRIVPDKKTGTPREVLNELMAKAAGTNPVPATRLSQSLEQYYLNNKDAKLALQGDANTLSAWLEQYLDAVNLENAGVFLNSPAPQVNYNFYVREYGLLCVPPDQAPPGALTVAEFLKRSQAEKAARAKLAEQAPQPKPAKD